MSTPWSVELDEDWTFVDGFLEGVFVERLHDSIGVYSLGRSILSCVLFDKLKKEVKVPLSTDVFDHLAILI
jgi:hypothetical protein